MIDVAVDLSTFSDEQISHEYWRRVRARRAPSGGRPKILRPCSKCGRNFSTVTLRKHEPRCTASLRLELTQRQASAAAHRLMDVIKAGRQWNVFVAGACLENDFMLDAGAQDTDFQPCTIKNFTNAFHTLARRKNVDLE